MIFVPEGMLEQLKIDINEGKIWGLRLVKSPVAVIEDNKYADMFGIVREIVNPTDDGFSLKTKRNDICGWCECEAYYSAFSYYDGDILRAVDNYSAVVDEKDAIQITEYEVLWSY